MIPHPHAEVLRAIADGVPLSEFEVYHTAWRQDEWQPLLDWCSSTLKGEMTNVRRKPQYIMVNGFKVPKPLDVPPKVDERYFIISLLSETFHDSFMWDGGDNEYVWLERNILHSTKEAAIAHAKAMVGIDPEYFK